MLGLLRNAGTLGGPWKIILHIEMGRSFWCQTWNITVWTWDFPQS